MATGNDSISPPTPHHGLEAPEADIDPARAEPWSRRISDRYEESYRVRIPRVNRQRRPMDSIAEQSPSVADGLVQALRQEIESLRQEIRDRTLIPEQPTVVYAPQVKLKEIIATVPVFNGHNMSVLQFARSCRRALMMLPIPTPVDAEINLVRAIKAKLQGHAYLATEDEPISTMDDLIDTLQAAFSPNRGTNYYRGELHNLYKRPHEHVLDYIARTKDLRQAIIESETRALDGHFERHGRSRLDCEILESFINGLPPELRTPLLIEDCKDLTEAFHALLKIQHLAERDAHRFGPMRSGPDPVVRRHNSADQNERPEDRRWQDTRYTQPRTPASVETERSAVICHYCKKTGHLKFDCELRRRNNERNNAQLQGNALGGTNHLSAGPAAPLEKRPTELTARDSPLPGSSKQ